jgi:hypothetical protein
MTRQHTSYMGGKETACLDTLHRVYWQLASPLSRC